MSEQTVTISLTGDTSARICLPAEDELVWVTRKTWAWLGYITETRLGYRESIDGHSWRFQSNDWQILPDDLWRYAKMQRFSDS